jgi:CRISPR system Cascade subunit CasD
MNNILLMRLESAFQAWPVTRYAYAPTQRMPTKSGVMGLLLACMGAQRQNADDEISMLGSMPFAVREDRRGEVVVDFHTTTPPLMRADGKIAKNPDIVHRELLADASFLVAIKGDSGVVDRLAAALKNPVHQPYMGRKAFVPSKPILVGRISAESPLEALAIWPRRDRTSTNELLVEVENGGTDQRPVRDVLVKLHPIFVHAYRMVGRAVVSPPRPSAAEPPTPADAKRPRGISEQIKGLRLVADNGRCVCCGDTAKDVHHVTYERYGNEDIEDVRSVCSLCHLACTRLEYSRSMGRHRTDPMPGSEWISEILKVRDIIIREANSQRS